MTARIVPVYLAIQLASLVAQPIRKYVPDNPDRGTSRIPAIFEMSGAVLPQWQGDALIGVDHDMTAAPMIYTIDRSGRKDTFTLEIPSSHRANVHGYAVATDGAIAVVGVALIENSEPASFLAIVPPDRKTQLIVRTEPYAPWNVTFVPDGSIWTTGYVFDREHMRSIGPDIVVHFDRDGKEFSRFPILAKARFGTGASPSLQFSHLRASSDRIAWFTNGLEYIEFSFDGRELARYPGPGVENPDEVAKWSGFGLSADNHVVYGATIDKRLHVWELDHEKRQWALVQVEDNDLSHISRLLGLDGRILVISGKPHEFRRYHRLGERSDQ
jgi:hypothetical protein